MKFIIIRGKMNAGKTTTCGMVYSELMKLAEQKHLFNGKTVLKDSLRYSPSGNSIIDFTAVLTIGDFKIGIISAGDIADDLKRNIKTIRNLNIDILLCCARSVDREGSAYRMILDNYAKEHEIVREIWVKYSKESSDKNETKRETFDEVVNQLNKLSQNNN